MKILLVDDHALVREGIRYMLMRFDGKAEIVEAECCSEAIKCCQTSTDFDLVLLDYILPDSKESGCLVKLRSAIPQTPIAMMSVLEEPNVIKKMIDQGAKGYIPKSSSSEIMFSALKLILSGSIYVPPQALKQTEDGQENENKNPLTARQKQILILLEQGRTNKEIAKELFLSEATIRTHVSDIFRQLNVRNRTQASHVASKMNLI